MINSRQLKEEVIDPILKDIGMHSRAASALMLGTCAQESSMGTYIKQIGSGPAVGIYQMEPFTHDDIWNNYIDHRHSLKVMIESYVPHGTCKIDRLKFDLAYATIMARVFYLRIPVVIPEYNDIEGLAKYWKKYYNTHLGKGTVEDFLINFKKYNLESLV